MVIMVWRDVMTVDKMAGLRLYGAVRVHAGSSDNTDEDQVFPTKTREKVALKASRQRAFSQKVSSFGKHILTTWHLITITYMKLCTCMTEASNSISLNVICHLII